MGALSRMEAWLNSYIRKGIYRNPIAAVKEFSETIYTMVPGLTEGTAYRPDPIGFPLVWAPTGVGERDGEIWLSNNIPGGQQGWIWQGSSWLGMAGGAGGSATLPGGSNTQVQFNDSGVFAGNAALTFNKSTGALTGTGSWVANTISAVGSGWTLGLARTGILAWQNSGLGLGANIQVGASDELVLSGYGASSSVQTQFPFIANSTGNSAWPSEAIVIQQNNARLQLGTGVNNYFYGDGTSIITAGALTAKALTTSAGALTINPSSPGTTGILLNGSAIADGAITLASSGAGWYTNGYFMAQALSGVGIALRNHTYLDFDDGYTASNTYMWGDGAGTITTPAIFQAAGYRGIYPTAEDDSSDVPNGLYEEVTGSPFPTAITWWTSSGKTVKVKETLITRNANKTPATITYKFYVAGTLTKTLTDTLTYSGAFETSRTRVVT
jgi:hypothetical protein